MDDLISRQTVIDAINAYLMLSQVSRTMQDSTSLQEVIERVPAVQPELIRCKDCKHWNQVKAYHGGALSFGFCASDDMWRSLYGETTEIEHIDTDDDFFCGYAERREE